MDIALRAEIIAYAAREKIKISYAALAAEIGCSPRSAMADLSATKNNRWVVSADTEMPAGYPPWLLTDFPARGEIDIVVSNLREHISDVKIPHDFANLRAHLGLPTAPA